METVLTVEPNGVAIAYRDSAPSAGTHPVPVVLVHGMGGDSRTWDRFARSLVAAGRRVVAVDLRGHGRSGRARSYLFGEFAADIAGLCDHLNLGTVDLVGHSLGGRTGSLIAQDRPDLVRRLVLEESPLPLRTGDPIPVLASRRPTAAELWHATSSLVRNPRATIAFDRTMTASAIEQFHTPDQQWWQRLPDTAVPTLFLRGARPGSLVDPRLLAEAAAALPTCTVRDIMCGHSIHRDRFRDFEAAVLPFLMD
ncbi:alpha/beta fold hydrolase [Rhodococcus phenolicus]|uniref:alpha/beta fold hydrolase n=1 Tax=Rhodococcus phenolicus TaxID=263849 RepID=UPI00082D5B83|nr:alpha/beta hydrolase [Rhodococcus phenolicus]